MHKPRAERVLQSKIPPFCANKCLVHPCAYLHMCECVCLCMCVCVDDADAHVHPLTQRMEAACLIDFMDRDTDAVASVVCRPHLLDADGCLSSHPLWIHTCVLTAREAAWPAGGSVRRRTRASGLVSPVSGRRRLLPLVLRAAS